LTQASELLPELEAIENVWDLLYLRSMQALVLCDRGEYAAAARKVSWIAEKGRESEVGWARTYALLAASAVHLGLGEREAARGLLAECFERPRAAAAIMDSIPEAVRTAIAAQDAGLAAGIVHGAESLMPAPRLPLHDHVAATIDALLAEVHGEHEPAAASFADAAAGWRGFSMPYEEAQALLGQGRCLVALGRAHEAAPVLEAAREIFARLGAKPALEEAEALLSRA
jgi:tetratricopeptide (TPR) repeat protein